MIIEVQWAAGCRYIESGGRWPRYSVSMGYRARRISSGRQISAVWKLRVCDVCVSWRDRISRLERMYANESLGCGALKDLSKKAWEVERREE